MPSATIGQVTLAAGQTTVSVTGSFTTPYAVQPQPTWGMGGFYVSAQTSAGFTLVFFNGPPAPTTLTYVVTTPDASPVATGSVVTAGTIVNNVRDDVPDPVYDASGNPLPDSDGAVRASTLYRWLTVAIRRAARNLGILVEDWTALAQTANQPWYQLDPAFIEITAGFSQQWLLDLTSLTEADTIWPSTSVASGQGLAGYLRKRAERLSVGLWPVPQATDPSTTLTNALGSGSVTTITVGSTANALSFGYAQLDNEIVEYQSVPSTTQIQTISRGVCGTTAASHLAGATVQFLGLWLKGKRAPATVTASASPVELPIDLQDLLETYLLARYRRQEQEFEQGTSLMKEFDQECARIKADPQRRGPESSWRIPLYGEPRVGPIYLPSGGGGMVLS